MKERGGNQTSGIDFFITQERIVFLDTQVPAQPLSLALSFLLSECGPLPLTSALWPGGALSPVPLGLVWVCVH